MANLIEIAGEIVAAHAANNKLTIEELLLEIGKVHAALQNLEARETAKVVEEVTPFLSVKKAFKKNEVICMVCGKGGFKTLTRHLSSVHQLNPGTYKIQYGISSKQPLSAKIYSELRRQMALDRGLADNLANARKIRMGNIEAKTLTTVKTAKAKAPASPANPSAKIKPPAKAKTKK
jgi:predicted transcriptional regulator